jgi:hypothetical protein
MCQLHYQLEHAFKKRKVREEIEREEKKGNHVAGCTCVEEITTREVRYFLTCAKDIRL